jgi:hypothetical protein
VELIKRWSVKREFYTKDGQHLNSRGNVSMVSRIARTVESMIKKKVDPISMKWYNDAATDSQKCQHQATQEKTRYTIMIKASDGDTIPDAKNVSPIKAQHPESIIVPAN